MKHSKKIAAVLLAAVLTAGTYLTIVGAAAPDTAPSGSGQPQTASTPAFADIPGGAWYEDEAAWCVENGIISGSGSGQLMPQGPATRAQTAQMLMNFIQKQQ